MITIQFKIHMYHFVLRQTNDIYKEIYNSYLMYTIEAKCDSLQQYQL